MPDVFTSHADIYDRSRRKLIPCFDKFYGTPAEILKAHKILPLECLDLGAGTGLLSAILAEDFGIQRLELLDQSRAMLDLAEKALGDLPAVHTVTSSLQDINDADLSGGYDAIWSSLAIHHLDGPEKQKLFRDVYALLKPGGIFINADQSLGNNPEIEAIYREQWLADVQACGVDEGDLASALERMKEDRMDPLDAQTAWMRDAGFAQVNVWFQDYSFNVYSGVKS